MLANGQFDICDIAPLWLIIAHESRQMLLVVSKKYSRLRMRRWVWEGNGDIRSRPLISPNWIMWNHQFSSPPPFFRQEISNQIHLSCQKDVKEGGAEVSGHQKTYFGGVIAKWIIWYIAFIYKSTSSKGPGPGDGVLWRRKNLEYINPFGGCIIFCGE